MRAVGLDIGAYSVKAVLLDGSAKRPRVVAYVEQRIAEGKEGRRRAPEVVGATIAKLFEKNKLPTDRVVVQVPAARCLLREIQVPFTRDDQIKKTIRFQAESAFHFVQIDQVIVDHYKIETTGEKSRLLVAGLQKEVLEHTLDALAFADLDPAAVDLDVAALYNAAEHSDAFPDAKPTLLVDLGASALKVVVAADGRLRAARSLRAQASAVKVEEEAEAKDGRPRNLDELRAGLLAEEREDTFFTDDDGRLPVVILDEEQTELFDFETEEARQSILQKVFFEIDRTLARTFLMEPIARIILTGGGSRASGLRQAFQEHFQAEVSRLELGGLQVAKLKPEQKARLAQRGQTALGLALKGLGADAIGFDFRQQEYAFAGPFERLKSGVACSLVLLFVLFFLIAYRYQAVQTQRLLDKQEQIVTFQQQIYRTVFGERPQAGTVLSNLNKRQRLLRQRLGEAVPDVISVLDIFRDLARAVKVSGKKVEFESVSFRQQQQTVQMTVDKATDVYDIKAVLDKGDYLVVFDPNKIKRSLDPKTQKLRATISFKLKNPPKKLGRRG